jgi:hypothetical protein
MRPVIGRCPFGAGVLLIVRVVRYPPAASQIATAKSSVKLADVEGPIDRSLGTKEALAVRLRKLAIDVKKTLEGTCVPAEFRGVVLQRLSTALTEPPEPGSCSSAPRSRTAYRGDTACRAPSSWYTKRAVTLLTGEMRHDCRDHLHSLERTTLLGGDTQLTRSNRLRLPSTTSWA